MYDVTRKKKTQNSFLRNHNRARLFVCVCVSVKKDLEVSFLKQQEYRPSRFYTGSAFYTGLGIMQTTVLKLPVI